MKKNTFFSSLGNIVVGAGVLLISPCSIDAAAPSAAEECSRELLLSYFPEAFVNDTLKRFNIPEDKWAAINKSLSNKDKEVVKLVEEKASAMTPNPLKDPQQRQAAVKLFRETLLQVFSEALKENGLTDTNQYQAMLDDIQQQKAKKFAECMEKEKQKLQQQTKSDKSNTKDNKSEDEDLDQDDDDDSDDEDEEDSTDEEKDADKKAGSATSPTGEKASK